MAQKDLVKITVKRIDRQALRIAAAHWGLSLQDAFARLLYGVNEANDAGLLKAKKPDAAISSEGGEDLGRG